MSCSTDALQTRLHRAARDGNTSALLELLVEHPLLLQRIGAESPTDTPLHIASLHGHVEFVAALLTEQPQLARMRDERGSYPLHLASAKGHVQVVKLMLRDLSLCKLRDKEQRTPLHSAAANGEIDVLKELLSHVDEATAHARTERGETTLHLAVKCNQMEAAAFLVGKDKGLLNVEDDQGNTVLHLATAKKQIQMLKLFLDLDGVDVKVQNEYGFTALDILVHGPSEKGDIEIGEMLRNAGCERGTEASKRSERRREPSKPKSVLCRWYKRHEKNGNQLKNKHNTLLIVATLIATVTFTAGLSPPGGVWSEPPTNSNSTSEGPTPSANYTPGTAIQAKAEDFSVFLACNTVGLVASCSIILLLVSGLPIKNRYMTSILIILIWVAILAMVVAFAYGSHLVSTKNPTVKILFHTANGWLFLMILVLAFHLIRGIYRILICKLLRQFRTGRGDNPSLGNPTDIEAGQGCCLRRGASPTTLVAWSIRSYIHNQTFCSWVRSFWSSTVMKTEQ